MLLIHAIKTARTSWQRGVILEDRSLQNLKDVAKSLNLQVSGDDREGYVKAIKNWETHPKVQKPITGKRMYKIVRD